MSYTCHVVVALQHDTPQAKSTEAETHAPYQAELMDCQDIHNACGDLPELSWQ